MPQRNVGWRARQLFNKSGPIGAVAWLSTVCDPQGAVFDIGVNRGTMALHLARIFSPAPIYLFEPLPDQADYVSNRFRRFTNMTIENMAVCDKNGTAEFNVSISLGSSSMFTRDTGEAARNNPKYMVDTLTVDTITLDSYCKKNKIDRISCVKIDAQGSEHSIFKGAKGLLKAQKIDMIMFEWFAIPHYDNAPLLAELMIYLESKGYSMYDIFAGRHLPNGQRRFGDAVFISNKFRQENLPDLTAKPVKKPVQ